MQTLVDILHRERCTLVVDTGGDVQRFHRRGVADLMDLLTSNRHVLQGARVADKAVGKAAAACMVQGGVKQVYADVMSQPALDLLAHHGIMADCGTVVDHIINRTGDDWCPLERLSRPLDDPAEIVRQVAAFLSSSH